MDIPAAVARLRARIARAAEQAGRDPAEITIVAASKARTPEQIAAAYDAGITVFGENRVQEWRAKRDACPPGITWHLIGPLQRNKARAVVGEVAMIQSIATLEVARTVSRIAVERNHRQPILLEVNVSGEASKHGVQPQTVLEVATGLATLPGVRLEGLMTVGHPDDPKPGFERLRALRDDLLEAVPTAAALSMGMSADLEDAIAAGATIVRPGTALFGARPPMP